MGKKRLVVIAAPQPQPEADQERQEVRPLDVKKRVKHARSRRYHQALTKVDRTKSYLLAEAINLLKQVSLAKFDASVEAHLNLTSSNLKVKVTFPHPTAKLASGARLVSGEPKSPLMHVVVGKLSLSNQDLISNISALITAVTLKRITKLTLASSMSPGIKVDLASLDQAVVN